MSYVTQAQLEVEAGGADRFLQLVDWNQDTVPDADVIAQAMAYVQGWIDGALRVRFATPIANPDITITQLGSAEMIFWLRSRRQMVSQADVDAHKQRERELDELATGRRRPAEPLPVRSTAVKSAIVPMEGRVGRELKGWP